MDNNLYNHHKKTRVIAIAALVVGVLGLTTAFAVLTQNLVINGTAQVKSATWDVHFGTPVNSVKTGEATITSTRVDNHTITFDATFSAPGDTTTLDFSMVNSGTIDAVIDSVTVTGASALTTEEISYTLTYANTTGGATAGANIAAGDTLNNSVTKNGRFFMIWNPASGQPVSADGPSTSVTITIAYKQN
jgi:hypothetical protein